MNEFQLVSMDELNQIEGGATALFHVDVTNHTSISNSGNGTGNLLAISNSGNGSGNTTPLS
jgi:bacteriocin-like protein